MSLRRAIKARRRSQSAEAQSARGKRPADERILDANLVSDRTILELREMITLIVGQSICSANSMRIQAILKMRGG
jgi:hypothetical protein